MYFAKYGSGEKVILGFHGWSGDHTTFEPIVKYLPEDATFYSFDLPGSGKSTPPEHWSIDCIVRQIAKELMSFYPRSTTLVGSCSGGVLSLFLTKYFEARGQQDRFSRIVLIDPFAFLPWYFKVFVARRMGKIGWYAYYSTFANPIGRWAANLSLHKHRGRETNLTASFAKVSHQSIYQYLKVLSESGGAIQFKGLRLPIDILYGENTFAAVKSSVQQWKQIFPQAHCYELKGAGHLPIEEATAELATILFQTRQSK